MIAAVFQQQVTGARKVAAGEKMETVSEKVVASKEYQYRVQES